MEWLLPIIIFAASTSFTPGPNNIMIMSSGLNFGVKRSAPHYFGICLGFPVMLALVGIGLGFVFDQYPMLHELIKVVGVVYLLYLSWIIANAVPKSLASTESKPISFIQAVIFQWVNPKAWIIATGAIAAFTSTASNIHSQVLMIALIFLIVTSLSIGAWLCLGVWLKKFFRDAAHQRVFNIAMAALLVISIMPVSYELVRNYLS